MRISQNKNVVELEPQSPVEANALEMLWRQLISCTGESAKLAPIGEFTPGQKNVASFVIESAGELKAPTQFKAVETGTYTCATCNRYLEFAAGDLVPICCGRPMELMD
jgi:hypothetical protein